MAETPDNLRIPPHPGTRWQPDQVVAEVLAAIKAKYNAKAGETIAGRLVRGNDGKFASAGGAAPARSKTGISVGGKRAQRKAQTVTVPKGRKGKAGKGKKAAAKPKGRATSTRSADAERRRQQREAERKARQQQRLQEQADAKIKRAGEQLAKQVKRDAATAKREAARTARQAEVEKRRAAREAERKARAEKPKAGGGGKGGGGKGKPTANLAANRATVATALKVDTAALAELAAGTPPTGDTLKALIADGLAEVNAAGIATTTPAGRTFLRAANRGDVENARAYLDRARGQRAKAQARTSRAATKAASGSMAVFKDARGRWRWLSITSSGYQDRDGEFVPVDELAADCERCDATKAYGPLRLWHIGQYDPLPGMSDQPWGPGLDIGDCDFNAMYGPFEVESGTFRSEPWARWAAERAPDLALSRGFHFATKEDGRIFRGVQKFERSVLPTWAASNPFTAFVTKEASMSDWDAQRAKLKAMGVSDEMLAGLEAQIATKEQQATAAGAALKNAQPTEAALTLAAALKAAGVSAADLLVAGVSAADLLVALKAEGDEEEPAAEAEADESAGEEEYLFAEDERAEIATIVRDELAKAMEAQNAAMKNMADAIRMLGQRSATKEAVIEVAPKLTALEQQMAALKAITDQLTGDQPGAARPAEPAPGGNTLEVGPDGLPVGLPPALAATLKSIQTANAAAQSGGDVAGWLMTPGQ